jgi:uncharacterized membrane protein
MGLTLLLLVQWLHILSGIAWFGGYIFLDLVLYPTLLKLPVEQAKQASTVIASFAGPVMATSGTLVVLLGIVRGTFLGPIQSFSFLLTSAYGIIWLIALAITVLLNVWGAGLHDRVIGPIWEGDRIKPGVITRLRAGTIFELTCFALVLACMVLMHMGLQAS